MPLLVAVEDRLMALARRVGLDGLQADVMQAEPGDWSVPPAEEGTTTSASAATTGDDRLDPL